MPAGSPHTLFLPVPIPVKESKSAPSSATPYVDNRFFFPGTDEFREQDTIDHRLIDTIRKESSSRDDHHTTTGRNTTELPNAMLLNIFNLAVHVPGALDIDHTEDIQYFTRLHGDSKARHPALAVSRHTAYALMALSKYWSVAARECGFRYIRIRTSKQLAVFAGLLKDDSGRGKGSRAPGEWVRRLDLHVWNWDWKKEDAQLLKDVFTMCPNLTCFSTVGSTVPPKGLELRAWPSLRRLELAVDHQFLQALDNSYFDRIEVLWVAPTREFAEYTVKHNVQMEGKHECECDVGRPLKSYCFPRVRTLVAGKETKGWVRRIHLPSLKAVLMDDSHNVDDLPDIQQEKVEHISASNAPYDTKRKIASGPYNMALFNDFIELKTISIKYSEISNFMIRWPHEMSESEVQYITIYDMPTGWGNESTRVLHENFTKLISDESFPHLKRVRLIVGVDGGLPALPSAMKSFWRNWLAICRDTSKAVEVLPDGRVAHQGPIELLKI